MLLYVLSIMYELRRDVNEEVYVHFHDIMSTLMRQVEPMAHSPNGGAPTPEISSKLFECVSLLIK